MTVINPAGLGFPAREQLPVITVHNRHAHQLAKDVVYDQATTGAIKEVGRTCCMLLLVVTSLPWLGCAGVHGPRCLLQWHPGDALAGQGGWCGAAGGGGQGRLG